METNPASMLPAAPGPPRRTGTPKVIGILNIIFGAALLLGAFCCAMQLMVQTMMGPMIAATQQQMQQQLRSKQEAERTDEIRKLTEQEEAAQTEDEKDALRNQRQALESTPLIVMPVIPDMSKMYGMNDRRVAGYSMTDILSGLLLNVVMVIAGAGLVAFKEWGRKLAVTVAATKIVRLVVLESYCILVVVPVMAKQMTDGMREMMSQMPAGTGGAQPPQIGPEFAAIYGTFMTVSAAGMLVFGSIYPATCLWLLTRSETRAACRPT